MALTFSEKTDSSWKCPNFTLLGVDGKKYSLPEYAQGSPLWIMFICNHCPYVKAIEDRILGTAETLLGMGYKVLAICSNDPRDYQEDSFENLKKRWEEKKYPFPYLFDETQEVAKKFEAVCTPDFYLFDQDHVLKYRGRLDDNWKNSNLVTRTELLSAAKNILAQQPIKGIVPSMGCSIKWLSE